MRFLANALEYFGFVSPGRHRAHPGSQVRMTTAGLFKMRHGAVYEVLWGRDTELVG